MVRSGSFARSRLTGGVVGVVAAWALAAMGSAPSAHATCASFFGMGNSLQCTSTPTSVAIAIGTNAQAHADGLFGTAFAAGTNVIAITGGTFTFATAVGDETSAQSYGLVGMATQLGSNGLAETVGSGGSHTDLGLNFALNVSLETTTATGSVVGAIGVGNIAVNLFGNGTAPGGHRVVAAGTLSGAMALGGTNNQVFASPTGGTLNYAFSIFGSNNGVYAGPGPVAVAGSILQTGQTVTKHGPGFNINGFAVGGAAAVGPHSTATRHTSSSSATAGGSGGKTAAHARTGRKKT